MFNLRMSEESNRLIRESIVLARQLESDSGELKTYLSSLCAHLHKAIDLPKNNPDAALLDFVVKYIEHTPDFLDAMEDAMREANIYEYGRVFIEIAQEFFLNPPEQLQERKGLLVLIDEAYLAHRLIEEVNDRLLFHCNTPLTPMDMTLSNIIVHDILGEEYANQLDLAVHYAVEALFQPDNLTQNSQLTNFIAKHKDSNNEIDHSRWPCLAGDSAITLNLQTEEASVHH